jgi:hypothetical protein
LGRHRAKISKGTTEGDAAEAREYLYGLRYCGSGRRRILMDAETTLRVDGEEHRLSVDTRTTLLDALRERLGITSPK